MIAAGLGAVIAGEEDPARPLNTLEVKGLTVVDDSQKPLFSEVNQALYHGLSPIGGGKPCADYPCDYYIHQKRDEY